jgi:hypothetical protein
MSELILAYPILAAMVVVAVAWTVVESAGAMKPQPVRVRDRSRR